MRVLTDNLYKSFGGVVALDTFPEEVECMPGKITAIIGPNGAGKTTLFNVMAGFVKPDRGSVFLFDDKLGSGTGESSSVSKGKDIVGLNPHVIAGMGIGVLFQDIREFKKLSALENVATGVKNQAGENLLNCLFRPGHVRVQEKEVLDRARKLLEYVGLSEKSHLMAEQLSYGQQKLVAIARLLAGEPKVLLLDEPTSGVHPDMMDKLLDLIQRLADNDGRVVMMIEHNLNVVRRVGDWVILMADGQIKAFGPPEDVLKPKLQALFPTL